MNIRRLCFSAWLAVFSLTLAAAPTAYWLEAETYKGNGFVKKDSSASGGAFVQGKSWYVLFQKAPAPLQDGEKLALWLRIRSDVPANWFLMRGDKKPFGWFSSKSTQWQWVKVGTFDRAFFAADGNVLPGISLQKPTDASATTATGDLDAVVFTDAADASQLDRMLQERQGGVPSTGTEAASPAQNTQAAAVKAAQQPSIAENAIIHWVEAEEFKGNGYLEKDADASAGSCVKGRTWYVLADKVPAPMRGSESLNLWARVRSDVPANWFLMGEDKKAFGWFASKSSQWHWVKMGKYTGASFAANNFCLPGIYLQKPQNQTIPTTTGYLDVLVFTDIDDPAQLDALLKLRNAPAAPSAQDSARLSVLKDMRRTAGCPILSRPPKLDGILSPGEWEQAGTAEDFLLLQGRGFPSQKTSVRIGRDAHFFYLAATLHENKMPFIRKARKVRNDNVWTDDCLEVFIDPLMTQKNPLKFTVNALGTRQDNLASRMDEADGNEKLQALDWEAVASMQKNSWTVEMRIPLALLGKYSEGAWGFNACRSEGPYGETTYWNNTGEAAFDCPEGLGILLFAPELAQMQGMAFDTQSGRARYFADSSAVKVEATLAGKREMPPGTGTSFRLPGGETGTEWNFGALQSGRYRWNSRFRNAQGKTILDLALTVSAYANGPVSVAWPAEERGNILHLLSGTAQHCFFLLGNHSEKTFEKPVLRVSVPECFSILNPATPEKLSFYHQVDAPAERLVERDGRKYREYSFSLQKPLPPVRIEKLPFHRSVLLYLRETESAVPGDYPVYYCLANGTQEEEEQCMTLRVLPRYAGTQPKHFIMHNWLWTIAPSPANWGPAIATQKAVGFNSLEAAAVMNTPEYVREIRRQGMGIVNNFWWAWENREYAAAHPEARALTFAGAANTRNQICPTVMLENDAAVLRQMLAGHMKQFQDKTADGLVWDLEGPFCWDICFCTRCLEAFRQYAGLPQGTPVTAADVRDHHAVQWIDFACRQSARLSQAIRKEIRHHAPAALFGIYSSLPSDFTRENYRIDWKQTAAFLDLALPSYYADSDSVLDEVFHEKMKAAVKELKQGCEKNRMVWATLTAGYGRKASMNPSAALVKMKVLRSIASGMDGVSFWWWGPFDGLYYQKMAEATNLIARFEEFFLAPEDSTVATLEHSYGKRISSYMAKIGQKKAFVLLFNHHPSEARRVKVHFQETGFREYPRGNSVKGKDVEVEIPPMDVIAFWR